MRTPDKKEIKDLAKIMLTLGNEEDLYDFLVDLCTPDELNSLYERWKVAKLVNQGIAYRQINEKTQVSTATITRVARSLNLGKGYRKALEKGKI